MDWGSPNFFQDIWQCWASDHAVSASAVREVAKAASLWCYDSLDYLLVSLCSQNLVAQMLSEDLNCLTCWTNSQVYRKNSHFYHFPKPESSLEFQYVFQSADWKNEEILEKTLEYNALTLSRNIETFWASSGWLQLWEEQLCVPPQHTHTHTEHTCILLVRWWSLGDCVKRTVSASFHLFVIVLSKDLASVVPSSNTLL